LFEGTGDWNAEFNFTGWEILGLSSPKEDTYFTGLSFIFSIGNKHFTTDPSKFVLAFTGLGMLSSEPFEWAEYIRLRVILWSLIPGKLKLRFGENPGIYPCMLKRFSFFFILKFSLLFSKKIVF
jgi:hypothetical protein